MATLIDGQAIAADIRANLPARSSKLHRKPGLGVILVGNDSASELYVSRKKTAAAECGVHFILQRFDSQTDNQVIATKLSSWNSDPRLDAILIQLPLPRHLNENAAINAMDPEKDVDGFHPVNIARYTSGERTNPPGLVEGIFRLIASTGKNFGGTTTTIVARPSVFTKCMRYALRSVGSNVAAVAADGQHRPATLTADIVIVAAGKVGLIVGDDLKPGCIVIDVGINPLPEGRVTGDVDRMTVGPVASWISPVPGGVGPVTIAMLLENTVRLAERNQA